MTPPNQLQAVSWEDWHVGPWYVIFERAGGDKPLLPRTYERPSRASWTRLMRAMTVRHVKARMKPTLRRHAAMEYVDRKVATAQAKAERK